MHFYIFYNVLFLFEDIDECDEMIDKCEHLCTNTEGSYTCRCYPRGHFYLNDDGFSCDG